MKLLLTAAAAVTALALVAGCGGIGKEDELFEIDLKLVSACGNNCPEP